ncbi:GNAT family N-acetyltransferase [Schumannella sp. 10F1B-5-1]|uniref:GNAT family N-acetyltransferase n=1 Tax=Schumannella sp. 10F1B-5-1 TaxID=2590780 RepID=UPI001130BBB9|nr:GNAT family N-acetyltransferase [Schumannella sp. 10F1B-5-1]TPW78482.1 GNAT family N-acetyltransferase [Schumannella sp. 10F1B-5-1]
MSLSIHVTEIVTARTRLRPLRAGDADALLAWQGDPETCRYLPYAPRSRAQVADFVRKFDGVDTGAADHDRIVFGIELTSDLHGGRGRGGDGAGGAGDSSGDDAAVIARAGEVVGEQHLVLTSAENAEVELGWVLHPVVAGRGLAGETARAVRDLVLDAGAHRLIAELDPRNTASARLCERLGMREEAHFRQNFRESGGGWADTGIWAMLASDPRP